MPSERIQRQIDQLLNRAEPSVLAHDWDGVRRNALSVLNLNPENEDAQALLDGAEREDARLAAADVPSRPIGGAAEFEGSELSSPLSTETATEPVPDERRDAITDDDNAALQDVPEAEAAPPAPPAASQRHRHRSKPSWRRRLRRNSGRVKRVVSVALVLAILWAAVFAATLSCTSRGSQPPQPPPAEASFTG